MNTPRPTRSTYAHQRAPRQEWAARAACATHPDPDMWFTHAVDEQRQGDALAICRACPVKAACLDYAMSVPNLHGIWGGTTPITRTRLRKRARTRKTA